VAEADPDRTELLIDTPSLGLLDPNGTRGGFLRRRENAYLEASGDIWVSPDLIRRHGLRHGDELWGDTSPPRKPGQGPALATITKVNGVDPAALRSRPEFSRLRAVQPKERLTLATPDSRDPVNAPIQRFIDLLCPFGKGQRALIVAPAKAGKTTVLLAVADGLARNHPGAFLDILLVDERPEEVSEMESAGLGEVVASSFDFPPERHVAVAEMVLERARRRVEQGDDVVIVLDSLTRLARAYNATERGNSRTLSGGLGANSLEKPKRFFGSARAVDAGQGGGSLTIIATALVDTGSKMDEVIFEEFKGTGNSELVLSRELAERRIWPAINLPASATRREELLLSAEELERSTALRQAVGRMPPVEAMKLVGGELR
jgi:transcription termination factor Rho